nr:hypothetical protein [Paenibacillus brasilensis]
MNEDTYEGDIKNPLSLNLYIYVSNNPLIYVDPTRCTQEIGGSEFDTSRMNILSNALSGHRFSLMRTQSGFP